MSLRFRFFWCLLTFLLFFWHHVVFDHINICFNVNASLWSLFFLCSQHSCSSFGTNLFLIMLVLVWSLTFRLYILALCFYTMHYAFCFLFFHFVLFHFIHFVFFVVFYRSKNWPLTWSCSHLYFHIYLHYGFFCSFHYIFVFCFFF
jgi:hypothetical protein